MSKYESLRKERLEEAKQKEPSEATVLKSTTIYHGAPTESGKTNFVEHPSYLRV